MRKFHLILWAIPVAVALSGCAVGGGMFSARTGGAAAGLDAAAKPLDTTIIQTQTLGPAPAGSAPATGRVIGAAPAAVPPAATATATATAPVPAAPQTAAEIGAAAAAALKAGASATTAAAVDASAAPAITPAAPHSAEGAACLQKGGRWGKAGDTGAMACFHSMKDAGKACSKESDCSSQCLARSRSCAPFWPMFGCTDIVQNDGAVVQLCLN